MIAGRAVPSLVIIGLVLLLAVGVWLLVGTPGSLVNEALPRLGTTPGAPDETVLIQVEEGENAGAIGAKLEQAEVIQSARHFRVLASLMGVSDRLEAGNYEFRLGGTALTAVRAISEGITVSLTITIPEGFRAEEFGELFESRGIVTAEEFLGALSDSFTASFLADLPPGRSLEGFLFPATYTLPPEVSAHDAVQRLLSAFDQRYQEHILPLLAGSARPLLEVITLASIVEREARVPEERPVIASVFANRLELGIALQADATVQYALADDPASVQQFGYWKRGLTIADLQTASPYNTYVNPGMPPGPIANPGLDSILAALTPAETEFLYFVARPDGSHVFAQTLEEHIRNVCEMNPGRPECG